MITEFKITEIVFKWTDGREEVRYRRPYGSESAAELMKEVEVLKERNPNTPYFYRHVEIES